MYQITKLPGGVTLATAEMPHMASATIGVWVGIGGRYESEPHHGACHFIEHMLFKGTRRRNAAEISEAIEGIGGYLNAFTSEESTCFYARASHEKLPVLIDVLGDMFLNSEFSPAEFEKERQVIKEEVAMYQDQPHHFVQELLSNLCWPNHPLGRSLTGTLKALDGLSRNVLVDFHKNAYVSAATVITAAGKLNHEEIVRGLKKFSKKIPLGERAVFTPASSQQNKPRSIVFTKPIEQTQLALGIRTCSRHDDRRFSLRLLNTILGENMSSRLFQTVREERGLAYSIYSSLSSFDDVGLLTVSAGLDPGRLHEALRVVLDQLRKMKDKAPSPAEFRRARDYVIGQMDLSLESTESQMNWLGENLISYGKVISPQEVRERLACVSAAEIRTVARSFFQIDRMNLAVVGSSKNKDKVHNLLESHGC